MFISSDGTLHQTLIQTYQCNEGNDHILIHLFIYLIYLPNALALLMMKSKTKTKFQEIS